VTNADARRWAVEEFSGARLGDARRTKRLIATAAQVVQAPAGRVSEAVVGVAEREGAYRLVEHEEVRAEELSRSASMASAQRGRGYEFVFVPVDQTSLNLPDPSGARGLGSIGERRSKARGLQVMNAIAVGPDGTPLGLFAQKYWVRPPNAFVKVPRRKRKLAAKETRYWLEAMESGISAWAAANVETKLWFQLDRGGDFREMLQWARDNDHWVTLRACHDRRALDADQKYLWDVLEATRAEGTYRLVVPARAKRPGRTATIEVRTTRVKLLLRDRWLKKDEQVEVTAVLAREVSPVARGAEPIEWLLLTNKLVSDFGQAREVIDGYSRRWRVEEFHKTWKSECNVEDTQLRDPQAITVWATLLAAVAMRIQRLMQLSRTAPDLPADQELSVHEIEAVIRLKQPKAFKPGDMPPISLAVQWIAELGGYTGKSSGGPPGAKTISRGLDRIQLAAELLRKNNAICDQ
jgi:hypothetical protein